MSELTNMVTSNGTYNSVPTELTSNVSVVNMIEGLTLSIEADQKNWVNGYLIYTITLSNQTEYDYVSPELTDVIDDTKVEFVEDSVVINDVGAIEDQYRYDVSSHTLTINLSDVAKSSTTRVTFRVKKKIQ